jgi:hypothetical protein
MADGMDLLCCSSCCCAQHVLHGMLLQIIQICQGVCVVWYMLGLLCYVMHRAKRHISAPCVARDSGCHQSKLNRTFGLAHTVWRSTAVAWLLTPAYSTSPVQFAVHRLVGDGFKPHKNLLACDGSGLKGFACCLCLLTEVSCSVRLLPEHANNKAKCTACWVALLCTSKTLFVVALISSC